MRMFSREEIYKIKKAGIIKPIDEKMIGNGYIRTNGQQFSLRKYKKLADLYRKIDGNGYIYGSVFINNKEYPRTPYLEGFMVCVI